VLGAGSGLQPGAQASFDLGRRQFWMLAANTLVHHGLAGRVHIERETKALGDRRCIL
jgi:hypothetical protein